MIVKAQARVDKTLRDPTAFGLGGQVSEVAPDFGHHVVMEAKVTDLAYCQTLDVAQDDGRVVCRGEFEDVLAVQRPR